MTTFRVDDMTCGRCASAIARAIAGVDQDARLDIRMQQKLVRIGSTTAAAELAEAIRAAGFTPLQVRDEGAAAPPRSGGCGCGCGSRKAAPVDPGQQAVAAGSSCCGQ